MNEATTTPDVQEVRRERLAAIVDEHVREVYDSKARWVVSGAHPCPRYALVTAEDAYRDNGNLTLHDTLEDLAKSASSECNEEYAWVPQLICDLDTNEELDWSLRVEVVDR